LQNHLVGGVFLNKAAFGLPVTVASAIPFDFGLTQVLLQSARLEFSFVHQFLARCYILQGLFLFRFYPTVFQKPPIGATLAPL
jgi:hypothetical protein